MVVVVEEMGEDDDVVDDDGGDGRVEVYRIKVARLSVEHQKEVFTF